MFIQGFLVDELVVGDFLPELPIAPDGDLDRNVVRELPIEVKETDVGIVSVEVPVDYQVDVGVAHVSLVVVGPGVVCGHFPALGPQQSELLLRFGVLDVQVYVDVPQLGVSVRLLCEEELLSELLPLVAGVLALGVDGANDDSAAGLLPVLH